jgi:hypothetical protein
MNGRVGWRAQESEVNTGIHNKVPLRTGREAEAGLPDSSGPAQKW